MTNKEYISTILGKFGVSAAEIDILLLEQSIIPDDPITETRSLKVAMYNQLPLMMAGLQEVSEGGYSVKWNMEGVKAWYSALAAELGLDNKLFPKPKITSKSVW